MATYPGVQSIGGVFRCAARSPERVHAIDIMIGSDMGLGDAINADVLAHSAEFGVSYSMWRCQSPTTFGDGDRTEADLHEQRDCSTGPQLVALFETPAGTTHVGAMLLFKKLAGRRTIVREIGGLPRPTTGAPPSTTYRVDRCRGAAFP